VDDPSKAQPGKMTKETFMAKLSAAAQASKMLENYRFLMKIDEKCPQRSSDGAASREKAPRGLHFGPHSQ